MGIRFYCPKGHRLNVKDFLAGKRGICPHCEVRFRIPRESEIPKGSPRIKPGSEAASMTNGKRRPKKTAAATDPFSDFDNGSGDTLLKSQPIKSEAGSRALRDPIEEAPDAVWYVRPPSGGQYGPAKGDIMRRWIAEGRVSADSLVWREGWTDWQNAGPLFPSLGGVMAGPMLHPGTLSAQMPGSGLPNSSPQNPSPQIQAPLNKGSVHQGAMNSASMNSASMNSGNSGSLNAAPLNPAPSNPAPSNPAPSNPAQVNPASSKPTAFHSVLRGPAASPVVGSAPRPGGAMSAPSPMSILTPLPSVTLPSSRAPAKKRSVLVVVGLAMLILVLAAVLVVVLVTKT